MSRFNLSGYSLSTWWAENKLWFLNYFKRPQFKELVKGVVSALLGVVAALFPENPVWGILFGAGGAYFSKLILDAIDYWQAQ